MTVTHFLTIQSASTAENLPSALAFQHWVDTTLFQVTTPMDLVIRIVDVPEMTELNQTYRHKQGATNILSFPFEAPEGVALDLLGDLVVCAPVIEREAKEQGKLLEHHWAHIIVHGLFHLLGYDHSNDIEAEEMETLEVAILKKLQISNPYKEH